jgi:Calpain family cysteine protease
VHACQAFAKAHGSYHAISGGYTKDAFTALTGAPTEVLLLDGTSFDSERAWLRLLSFAESRFPMVSELMSTLCRHIYCMPLRLAFLTAQQLSTTGGSKR